MNQKLIIIGIIAAAICLIAICPVGAATTQFSYQSIENFYAPPIYGHMDLDNIHLPWYLGVWVIHNHVVDFVIASPIMFTGMLLFWTGMPLYLKVIMFACYWGNFGLAASLIYDLIKEHADKKRNTKEVPA